MKGTFDHASDSVKRLNPHLFGTVAAVKQFEQAGTRIRQSTKPLMNKLETEFKQEYLDARYPKAHAQAIRFRLGNGLNYTPDFVDLSVQPVKAWELKGPWATDDAIAKLKMAAHEYQEVRWILVWKQDGQWKQQEVLP